MLFQEEMMQWQFLKNCQKPKKTKQGTGLGFVFFSFLRVCRYVVLWLWSLEMETIVYEPQMHSLQALLCNLLVADRMLRRGCVCATALLFGTTREGSAFFFFFSPAM